MTYENKLKKKVRQDSYTIATIFEMMLCKN
jgi:hypothetical protein